MLLLIFLILIDYNSEFCLTENCNSKCLYGNNINESTKLSNNSNIVLSHLTNINDEKDENTSSILNKPRKDSSDRLIFGNLNINSINSKFDQIKFRLQGKVDILVLTETKLDNSFPTNQFLIEGYSKPFRQACTGGSKASRPLLFFDTVKIVPSNS